jgi:stage V sporulation protein SpoVS
MGRSTDTVLKVSGATDPGKLAKSIEMTAKEQGGEVTLRAMGPHSVNQAVKALIIARQNLVAQAADLLWTAGFDVRQEGLDSITVIVLKARVVG